jgi:cytoskeleton protein RodZ
MNPDQTSAQNTAEGAGAVLRKARESKGMHISFLANTLRIPVARIKALEEDRFSDLPDLVFARALAQSICRQLKIEAAPVLAAMPDPDPLRSVRVTAANSQPLGGLASSSRVTQKRWLLLSGVLLVLIWLVVGLHWFDADRANSSVQTPEVPPPQTEIVPAEEPPASGVASDATVSMPKPVVPSPVPGAPVSTTPASVPATTPSAGAPEAVNKP